MAVKARVQTAAFHLLNGARGASSCGASPSPSPFSCCPPDPPAGGGGGGGWVTPPDAPPPFVNSLVVVDNGTGAVAVAGRGGGGGACGRGPVEACTPGRVFGFVAVAVAVCGDVGFGRIRKGAFTFAVAVFKALLSTEPLALFAGPAAMMGDVSRWYLEVGSLRG